ncbi:MAG: hypothetical protein K1X79_10355 [Oligoflexia bacterium]|nr:hypothetical protein [Oligoflexia bacterium]
MLTFFRYKAANLAALYALFSVAQSFAELPPALQIPDSHNQVIILKDSGIEPNPLRMKLSDSIVFVLNDSKDSLATVVFDFGKKQMHCSGSNLEVGDDGTIRSKRPFGPRDFASTCFHEKGEYKLTVYGLKARPSGLVSTIFVE